MAILCTASCHRPPQGKYALSRAFVAAIASSVSTDHIITVFGSLTSRMVGSFSFLKAFHDAETETHAPLAELSYYGPRGPERSLVVGAC